MTVLLKDAIAPNLVQTLENNPAFIHGGPFANIAHGCNSVIATTTALKLADYVVTEAGFGADLGAEKFFDIKCRKAGLKPAAAVIVATIRALKMHGGVAKEDLGKENIEALKKGAANLARHIENVKKFGVPPIVAINRFVADTDAEMRRRPPDLQRARRRGDRVQPLGRWLGRASRSWRTRSSRRPSRRATSPTLYPDDMPLWDKVRTIAQSLYGAQGIIADKVVRDRFHELEKMGFGNYPVCMAKTQYSFSTDPNLKGAPSNHVVPVREVRLSAGAEFIVVICGEIMTMPGLPRVPSANNIKLNAKGEVEGLF